MRTIIAFGAAVAALTVSVANAADMAVQPRARSETSRPATVASGGQASQAPIGVAGARWGTQCWIDTGQYAGYWGACPRSVTERRTNGRASVAR